MVNAAGGDKFIVNGQIQPKLTVRRRKYRFRFLNTGPTQTYDIYADQTRWLSRNDGRYRH